jgi:hypothetical protein
MNRREFLQRGGGLTAAVGLAGCLGDDPGATIPEDGEDATETTDDGRETDEGADDEFSGIESAYDEPFQTIPLDDRNEVAFPENNRPHDLRVWNAADSVRDVSLRVARDDEVVLDRTVEFAADAFLFVVMNEPAEYVVSVGLADDEPTTFEVSRDSFDCNESATNVGVITDGSVETSEISTLVACPGPKVAETELSVGQSQCGTEHGATVAFDHERVRVDGKVRTATPHAELELAGATLDEKGDLLTVRVRASESDDSDAGTQCTGEVSYEATVGFDHALPSEVAVVHESMDETTEVVRAERSG